MALLENLFNQFGWNHKKPYEPVEDVQDKNKSFQPPIYDDGAVIIQSSSVHGAYLDVSMGVTSEAMLVARYREMALQPEVDAAIEDVVNEAIVMNEDYVVRANVDDIPLPDSVKKKIACEFENVLELFDFNTNAYKIFRQWYIDGRINYHMIIDEKSRKEGINELRFIDPRKIKKVREVEKEMIGGVEITTVKEEYYVFNDRGFQQQSGQPASYQPDSVTYSGVKITEDCMVRCTSGLTDENGHMALSYLHRALKPINQLRTLEDAAVIYRVSRAPERRVFYVDTNNMNPMKAEQYVRDMMVKNTNRLMYDSTTGEIKDDRKIHLMLDDYWLARRSDGGGTRIEPLAGGSNLGEMGDIEYFKNKLYEALGVPSSRQNPDAGVTLGRASEISRDELKFNKFIKRIRKQFSNLLLDVLKTQLLLKKIISPEDWSIIKRHMKLDYARDNHFTELKEIEILSSRMVLVEQMQAIAGVAYSWRWIRKNILKQTDEEIAELDKEMAEELNDPRYMAMANITQSGFNINTALNGDKNPTQTTSPIPSPKKSSSAETSTSSSSTTSISKTSSVTQPEGQSSAPVI